MTGSEFEVQGLSSCSNCFIILMSESFEFRKYLFGDLKSDRYSRWFALSRFVISEVCCISFDWFQTECLCSFQAVITYMYVLWVSILVNFHILGSSVYQQVPSLEQLCPFSTFCHSRPSTTLNNTETTPCCLPCSCSDKCWLTGNCCMDKILPGDAVNTSLIWSCKPQTVIYGKLLNITLPVKTSLLSYRVIDTCPWERLDNMASSAPASACYNSTGLSGITFVSDAETHDVYINDVCAKCNGVDNFTYWKLGIMCPPDTVSKLKSFRERDDRIRDMCLPSSVPPTYDIGIRSLCFPYAINTCNVTGQLHDNNPALERKCHDNNNGFMVTHRTRVYSYANVHCYMCNTPQNTTIVNICPRISFNAKRGLSLALTAFINITKTSKQPGNICGETEVMDPFLVRSSLKS